jgi:hypothetical protein
LGLHGFECCRAEGKALRQFRFLTTLASEVQAVL